MQITVYSHPVPHIVVDNFLGSKTNQKLLGMIATIQDRLIDAEIIDIRISGC